MRKEEFNQFILDEHPHALEFLKNAIRHEIALYWEWGKFPVALLGLCGAVISLIFTVLFLFGIPDSSLFPYVLFAHVPGILLLYMIEGFQKIATSEKRMKKLVDRYIYQEIMDKEAAKFLTSSNILLRTVAKKYILKREK